MPATPAPLADIGQGVIVDGTLTLLPPRDADGNRAVNWQRSSGSLKLAGLASAGEESPRLSAGSGTLEFSRGHTKLLLDGGEVDAARGDVRAPRLAAHRCAAHARRAAG